MNYGFIDKDRKLKYKSIRQSVKREIRAQKRAHRREVWKEFMGVIRPRTFNDWFILTSLLVEVAIIIMIGLFIVSSLKR